MLRLLLILSFLIVSGLSVSANDIVSAKYNLETQRYDHCVLGDCWEYGSVEATMEDGQLLTYLLPSDSVFEDIAPRLVPLGLNRRTALLTVRSYLDKGAALALLDRKGGKLQIVAESEPIGISHRWQNPIGAGDFDRDGVIEIATVLTPHIGGKLVLYERKGNKLVRDKSQASFSNHVIGSSELDMHEVLDWNQDKVVDIILPDHSRKVLMAVTFDQGKFKILDKLRLTQPIVGPIVPHEGGVKFLLDDATEEVWHPR